jgi:hypothetical protein
MSRFLSLSKIPSLPKIIQSTSFVNGKISISGVAIKHRGFPPYLSNFAEQSPNDLET